MPSSSSMIYWGIWFLVVLVSFGGYEAYCLKTNRMTLSRTVWTVQQHFPLFESLLSLIVGILLSHFFWEGGYCAPNTPVLSMLFGG